MSEFSCRWVAKSVQRPDPPPSEGEAPVAKAIQFTRVGSDENDEEVLSHLLIERLLQDVQGHVSSEHFELVSRNEFTLRMALEELFTNASRYGHPEDELQPYSPHDFVFECSFEFGEKVKVIFTMTDCGPDLPEPIEEIAQKALKNVELPHYRGLALFLRFCRMTVDFVRINKSQKKVVLVGEYE